MNKNNTLKEMVDTARVLSELEKQLREVQEDKAFLEKHGKQLTGEYRKEVDNAIEKKKQEIEHLQEEINQRKEVDRQREQYERDAARIYDRRTERTLDGMKALYRQYEYEARCNPERTEKEIEMFIKLADEMKEKIFDYVMDRVEEDEDGYLPFN